MASILAIVSKKVFERDFRVGGVTASLGDVVATDAYASTHPSFDKLNAGGDLFLVTVAPGEQLWLAGVLAAPTFAKDRWVASANAAPITDISALIPKLSFENGKGLTAKPGALGMSLQTPRTLANSDVELLRAAAGIKGGAKAAAARSSSATNAAKPGKAASKTHKADSKPDKAGPKPDKAATSASKRSSADFEGAFAGDNPLESASKRLAFGAFTVALDDLLRAWDRCKAAELGDLIDRYGAWLASKLPAIRGNKNAIDAAWREVGELARPADVPRLVAAFEVGSAPQVEGWLDMLDLFPTDPRMCAPALVMTTKFVSSTAGPTRTRAFRMAEKVADGRCIETIDKMIKKDINAWNTKDLKDRLRKMRAKFVDPPALPAADAKTVAAIAKQVAALAKRPAPDEATLFAGSGKAAGGDGERLLAEVLAAPDDDAPRLVYADFLQQQGDPRGELIALQLLPEPTAAQRARIGELVKDKKKIGKWLGALAPVVSEPVFARGFLDACKVELKTPKHRTELVNHPLWSTVRKVETDQIALVESAAMKSLREVGGLTISQLMTLVRRPKPLPIRALTGLTFNGYVDDDDDQEKEGIALWQELSRLGSLPELAALEFAVHWESAEFFGTDLASCDWLWGTKLGKQLEELAISFTNSRDVAPRLAGWLPVFATHPKLRRLEHRIFGRQLGTSSVEMATIAVRDGKQLRIDLELSRIFDTRVSPVLRPDIRRIPEMLDGFPVKTAPRLRAVVTGSATKKHLELVQTHLQQTLGKRFDDITTVLG